MVEMKHNIISLNSERQSSPVPWTIEGFSEVEEGDNLGFMLIAADQETIVAQCLSAQNAELIQKSVVDYVKIYNLLEDLVAWAHLKGDWLTENTPKTHPVLAAQDYLSNHPVDEV